MIFAQSALAEQRLSLKEATGYVRNFRRKKVRKKMKKILPIQEPQTVSVDDQNNTSNHLPVRYQLVYWPGLKALDDSYQATICSCYA